MNAQPQGAGSALARRLARKQRETRALRENQRLALALGRREAQHER